MTTWSLADLWESLADAGPDLEVLVAGEHRRTRRELDERATRLASHLAAAGVSAGDHVGVYSFNRVEYMETLLALFKLRAVPINVNYRYVDAELSYIFRDSEIVALVFERGFGDRVAAMAAELGPLRAYVELADGSSGTTTVDGAVGYEAAIEAGSAERAFGPRSDDDRYIIYTGGTTGMPKGTVWRHEDIFFGALGGGAWCGGTVADPDDVAKNAALDFAVTFMVLAPLMHGAAQWLAIGGLLAGGRVVVYTDRHFDAQSVLRIAEREKVNSIALVGDAMARPLADELKAGSYDLSSLFSIGSGGAIFSDAVKAELLESLPSLYLPDSYGSSELGAGGRSPGAGSGARFAMEGDVAVLDEVTLQPVEPGSGAVGKIARRGHIPLGYWNDDAKTAATFPTVDGVRWAIPGDYATVDADGTVVLLGRGSQCINTGGEKVYPEEVEAALKAHPSVYDAVVVGVPDQRFGERVVAVVAPRPDAHPTLEELAAHCRTLVAGYKVPRELVVSDTIRRTNVGKLDYGWARAIAAGKDAP